MVAGKMHTSVRATRSDGTFPSLRERLAGLLSRGQRGWGFYMLLSPLHLGESGTRRVVNVDIGMDMKMNTCMNNDMKMYYPTSNINIIYQSPSPFLSSPTH